MQPTSLARRRVVHRTRGTTRSKACGASLDKKMGQAKPGAGYCTGSLCILADLFGQTVVGSPEHGRLLNLVLLMPLLLRRRTGRVGELTSSIMGTGPCRAGNLQLSGSIMLVTDGVFV